MLSFVQERFKYIFAGSQLQQQLIPMAERRQEVVYLGEKRVSCRNGSSRGVDGRSIDIGVCVTGDGLP